jgi:hypothetical protein
MRIPVAPQHRAPQSAVPLHDIDECEGRPFIAIELLENNYPPAACSANYIGRIAPRPTCIPREQIRRRSAAGHSLAFHETGGS